MKNFFTRTGDDGNTGLLGEGRVPKNHPIPETVGTIDEAGAAGKVDDVVKLVLLRNAAKLKLAKKKK